MRSDVDPKNPEFPDPGLTDVRVDGCPRMSGSVHGGFGLILREPSTFLVLSQEGV